MSSNEENGDVQKVIDIDHVLTIADPAPPAGIHFSHMKLNRQVKVLTDNMAPGGVSDEIIDAVFELVALNYPSVTTILEDHGFEWGRKEDVDTP
jgi:hypothetical protein